MITTTVHELLANSRLAVHHEVRKYAHMRHWAKVGTAGETAYHVGELAGLHSILILSAAVLLGVCVIHVVADLTGELPE